MDAYFDKKVFVVVGVSTAVCGLIAYGFYRRLINAKSDTPKSPTLQEPQSDPASKSQEEESLNEVEYSNRVAKVLVLGLDGSGKSAIVASMCGNKPTNDFAPTQGFNVVSTQHLTSYKLELWEIGGNEKTRKYWSHFYKDTDAVMFVVDASNMERMDECREVMTGVMDQMSDIPYVVVVNKQDVAGAGSVDDVAEALKISTCPAAVNVRVLSAYVPFAGRHGGVTNLQRILNECLVSDMS